jgi:Cytochrome P460
MHKSKTMYKKLILLSLVSLIVLLNLSFGKKKTKRDKLKKIAKEYMYYEQKKKLQIIVTDSAKYKWTIALCKAPKNFDMGWHYKRDSLFISNADSVKSPHGNKLYQLFIRNRDAYSLADRDTQPIGQVIVKEVWNVQAIQHDTSKHSLSQIQSSNDGKWYTPTTVSQLFIMYKEKQDSTNDKGWVYGIVDIEDNKPKPVVLFEGKISTCMSCHANTKYDRMFGLK